MKDAKTQMQQNIMCTMMIHLSFADNDRSIDRCTQKTQNEAAIASARLILLVSLLSLMLLLEWIMLLLLMLIALALLLLVLLML